MGSPEAKSTPPTEGREKQDGAGAGSHSVAVRARRGTSYYGVAAAAAADTVQGIRSGSSTGAGGGVRASPGGHWADAGAPPEPAALSRRGTSYYSPSRNADGFAVGAGGGLRPGDVPHRKASSGGDSDVRRSGTGFAEEHAIGLHEIQVPHRGDVLSAGELPGGSPMLARRGTSYYGPAAAEAMRSGAGYGGRPAGTSAGVGRSGFAEGTGGGFRPGDVPERGEFSAPAAAARQYVTGDDTGFAEARGGGVREDVVPHRGPVPARRRGTPQQQFADLQGHFTGVRRDTAAMWARVRQSVVQPRRVPGYGGHTVMSSSPSRRVSFAGPPSLTDTDRSRGTDPPMGARDSEAGEDSPLRQPFNLAWKYRNRGLDESGRPARRDYVADVMDEVAGLMSTMRSRGDEHGSRDTPSAFVAATATPTSRGAPARTTGTTSTSTEAAERPATSSSRLRRRSSWSGSGSSSPPGTGSRRTSAAAAATTSASSLARPASFSSTSTTPAQARVNVLDALSHASPQAHSRRS